MSPASLPKNLLLRDRADMLATVRLFFMERGVTEVDCPIVSARAAVDAHIDLISAFPLGKKHYLHSSPEYGMKRLLADGMGDIYQLSHVFREGESSAKHNPEFMMAEWYRIGMPLSGLIEETIQFIQLFVGDLPYTALSYRDVFKTYLGIDYVTASEKSLLGLLHAKGIEAYPNILEEGKDALLNLLLGALIEPQLGQDGLFVLKHYPASQAALARTLQIDDEQVGERFEVYYKGMELANGYHELIDPVEQRRRFEEANKTRIKMGKEALPIDEYFLHALRQGLPDCSGVAVGFDRLMMLRHNATHIGDVIPFLWEKA